MRPKNPKQQKINKPTKYKSGKEFIIKLPFELHDFSEELSFDQIMDTLFILGQYKNNADHKMFNQRDLPSIKEWLTRNNINDFLEMKNIALEAQAKVEQEKQYVREIMQMPVSRERWH